MKVAIIGGTGFIGRNITKRFVDEGINVVAISRNPIKFYERMGGKIEAREANILYPQQISDAIRGCDVVINCAGIIREKGGNTFEGVHIQGVINILHALKENRITRFVHISALGAGRGIETRYFRTKEIGEKLIVESGLEWTIFRPSIVIGEDGGIFKKIKDLSISPVLILPDMRGGKNQVVSVEDLTNAVFISVVKKMAVKAIVELGGRELSMDELILRILQKIGKRRLIIRLPLQFSLSLIKTGERILDGIIPISSDEIIMATQKITCSSTEVAEKLGITLKDPFEG
jgi:NADH dehydrogenase